MRNTIDYGIDLGTTNSAIARMENGVPVIIKSDTMKDSIPSCVHFNRKGDIIVGDSAINIMKSDNARALKMFDKGSSNTFVEFKRTMGTTHTYECPNAGKSFTSEELSAEVLKKLKSFVREENISSIVITVPAKFLIPQHKATIEAAKLAGFRQVELLQEPVAVAIEYGFVTKNKNGFWLVFHFGGGSFDAALIESKEGILFVKDTDGDNWLGGKNLDEAIVDQIIIPNLKENYAIDTILNDPIKREKFRNAIKPFAEDIKIQMSFKDTCKILSNLGELPFEDELGNAVDIDILVTQKDMAVAQSPVFQKAIDIVMKLLKKNNLNGSDLSAMILVGKSTYSPILRRMLREQITDKIDTSVDPGTAIARGAALFASTIPISKELIEAEKDKTIIQLDIKYEPFSVDTEELIIVKILKDKTSGNIPDKIYVDIVRSDGAWSSGKKPVGEKATLIEITLNEDCSNSFDIFVYDEKGNKLECQPNQINMLWGPIHTEKLEIEMELPEPPTIDFLVEKINEVKKMEDGQIEQLQKAFQELENLINEWELKGENLDKFKNELEEYRKQKDLFVSERPFNRFLKYEKLVGEMEGTKFMLLMQVEPIIFIQHFAEHFDTVEWKDPVAAKKFVLESLTCPLEERYDRLMQIYALIYNYYKSPVISCYVAP